MCRSGYVHECLLIAWCGNKMMAHVSAFEMLPGWPRPGLTPWHKRSKPSEALRGSSRFWRVVKYCKTFAASDVKSHSAQIFNKRLEQVATHCLPLDILWVHSQNPMDLHHITPLISTECRIYEHSSINRIEFCNFLWAWMINNFTAFLIHILILFFDLISCLKFVFFSGLKMRRRLWPACQWWKFQKLSYNQAFLYAVKYISKISAVLFNFETRHATDNIILTIGPW